MKKEKKLSTSWNLEIFYKNIDDPKIEKDRKIVKKKSYEFINKWKDRDDYLKNPKVLAKALEEYEKWLAKFGSDGNEGYYLWLSSVLDQENTEIKAKLNKVIEMGQKIENDIQFFAHRIATIDKKQQSKFLNSSELKKYKHFLKRLFLEANHLLTEDQEKIMNLKSKVSYYNWVQMTEEFLSKEEKVVFTEEGKKEKKSFSEIISLIDNKKQKVRDSAALALNEIFEKWIDVGEHELNSVLENKKINDTLRNYKTPEQARLLDDDMDIEVVESLRESVVKKFETSRKYYKLKARLLGKDKLEYHERNVHYGEISKKYNFDETVNLVGNVFRKLDPLLFDIFQSFLDEGRVDVFPKKGKASGAFCTEGGKELPVFVMLNHTNKLNDVLTFAHEMGHGVHHTLMKKQNTLYAFAPVSTAEVSSTFMEDFVLQELLKDADDELRLTLYMMKLNEEVSTIHRQIGIYNFEKEINEQFREKGYLSKKEIGLIFKTKMEEYMGDSVIQSPGSENWWLYISHIRSFFYVYSYSSGLLISKSLQHFVKENPQFIKKVIKFFESGSSESPKNIFKKLGVDITKKNFWYQGLNEIDELLTQTETLAKKLGKLK